MKPREAIDAFFAGMIVGSILATLVFFAFGFHP